MYVRPLQATGPFVQMPTLLFRFGQEAGPAYFVHSGMGKGGASACKEVLRGKYISVAVY